MKKQIKAFIILYCVFCFGFLQILEAKMFLFKNKENLIKNIKFNNPVGRFIKGPKLNIPRHGHTATLLDDGKVLIAGGEKIAHNLGKIFDYSLDKSEIYTPQENKFIKIDGMNLQRHGHTAIKLENGKVLFFGGISFVSTSKLSTKKEIPEYVEEYDPETQKFKIVGKLLQRDPALKAVKRDDGKIFIFYPWSHQAEIYDPETNISKYLELKFKYKRTNFDILKLKDGRIMVIGGNIHIGNNEKDLSDKVVTKNYFKSFLEGYLAKNINTDILWDELIRNGYIDEKGKITKKFIELEKPSSMQISENLKKYGLVWDAMHDVKDEKSVYSAEIYNPKTNEIELIFPLKTNRRNSQVMQLPNEDIIVIGGYKNIQGEHYSVEVEKFRLNKKSEIVGKLNTGIAVSEGSLVLIKNRYVLIIGLPQNNENIIEAYDMEERAMIKVGSMYALRGSHTITTLLNGNILITGGSYYRGKNLKYSEIFVVNNECVGGKNVR